MKDSSKKTEGFSQRLIKLEDIYNKIKTIEPNNVEDLLLLYQEGIVLAKKLEDELQQFEQKISIIESEDIDFTAIHSEETPALTTNTSTLSQEENITSEPTTESSTTNDSINYLTDLFSEHEE